MLCVCVSMFCDDCQALGLRRNGSQDCQPFHNCARCCSKRMYFADEVIFNEHGFARLFPGENRDGMWYSKFCAVEEK